MPTYVFEYFNLRARGELIRLIFAEAGEKYEDKRFSFEEWPKHKPSNLTILVLIGWITFCCNSTRYKKCILQISFAEANT